MGRKLRHELMSSPVSIMMIVSLKWIRLQHLFALSDRHVYSIMFVVTDEDSEMPVFVSWIQKSC
jgi:hypothetical protein